MYIDLDRLEDEVKPQIKNTRKHLESGYDSLNSISIPSDFSHRSKLINVSQAILDINDRVYSIGSWIDTQINNFSDAEYSNKGLMENLGNASLISSLDGNTYSFGVNGEIALEEKNIFEKVEDKLENAAYKLGKDLFDTGCKIGDWAESAYSYVASGELIDDAKYIGAKVVDGFEFVYNKIEDWSESAYNYVESGELIDDAKYIAKSAYDYVESGELLNDAKDIARKTGAKVVEIWEAPWEVKVASAVNAVGAVIKGVGKFGELLDDFYKILQVAGATVFTTTIDYLNYLFSDDEEKNWTLTKNLWEDTMSYVAEDRVGNIYDWIYETKPGQWLDENACGILKSDGALYGILTDMGYYTPIYVFQAFPATAPIAPFLTAAAGFSKEAEKAWAAEKAKHEEELQELYERGEITEAEKENMKEDWVNLESWREGMLKGTLNAGVEAFLYGGKGGKLGGALNKVKSKVSPYVVAALKTPAFALIDSVDDDVAFTAAFEARGGFKSMAIEVAITGIFNQKDKLSKNKASKINNANRDKTIKELEGNMNKEVEKIASRLDEYGVNKQTKNKIIRTLNEGVKRGKLESKATNRALNGAVKSGQITNSQRSQVVSSLKVGQRTLTDQSKYISYLKEDALKNVNEVLEKEMLNKYGKEVKDFFKVRDSFVKTQVLQKIPDKAVKGSIKKGINKILDDSE